MRAYLAIVLAVILQCGSAPRACAALPIARDTIAASIEVDSGRRVVVITAGAWTLLPAGNTGGGAHDGHHTASAIRFVWPVDGWVHGLRFRAFARDGRSVSRAMLHHLEILNPGRRDLFLQMPERTFEMGSETADILLPATVGIPVTAGAPMAVSIAWRNAGTDTLHDVMVELTVDWTPVNMMPRPVTVLPVTMQVLTSGGETSFDVPPGQGTWATDYPLSIDGRVLAFGGHLHDYGIDIQLSDVSVSPARPMLRLASQHDGTGRVTGVERKEPGVAGSGIKLRAGHVYQLVGRYANSSGRMIAHGGMAYLVILFAPGRPDAWPPADTGSVVYRAALASHGLSGTAMPMAMHGPTVGHP
ncbi:MAG: hypothetical protein ACREL5_03275 [Gemmatimonadales bacterium]